MRPSRLEVHVPISPTPVFFNMVRYLAASLRLNGGEHAASRIVVTVGEDCEPDDLYASLPWSRRYPIEWRWLDRELFRRHGYFATALERFRHAFGSPMVMLADADLFFSGGFGEVVAGCEADRTLAGLIAHISPFMGRPEMPAPAFWARLFATAGLGQPALACEHTGWGTMSHDAADRYCPPYFNLGMLVAPAEIMAAIGSVIYDEMAHVNAVLDTPYRCQLALTLAAARLGISCQPLSMRYNYPNDDQIASRYVDELADVRAFHYLRQGAVSKTRDFESPECVARLISRTDLEGVNLVMVRALARVHAALIADSA